MNKDLGEKQKRIRISLGLVMPLLYPVIGLLMLGFVVFPTPRGDGTSTLSQVLSVISVVAAVLLVAYIVRQITHSGIELYENGFILKKALSQRVFMRDDIKVIYWDRPGQFAGTTRTVVRKTNGFAEVTLTSGEVVKIPDSAYKKLPDELGQWQAEQKIPFEY
ncbi:MAG: hypothetical protein GX257_00860 [Clostridiales bacterium]|jgi:hypothetical protein|nr:hypothetical protein [Clostridiales bacterium]